MESGRKTLDEEATRRAERRFHGDAPVVERQLAVLRRDPLAGGEDQLDLAGHPPQPPHVESDQRAASERSRHHLLGRAHDQLNDRDRATIEWRAAIASAPSDDPDEIRSRARAAIARTRR